MSKNVKDLIMYYCNNTQAVCSDNIISINY